MVCSDNQEEIGGYKSLAEYMGATVEEVEEPVEATRSRNLQRCFNPHGPVPFGDASHVKIQRVGRPTNDQKSVCSRANNTLAEGEAARVPFIRGSGGILIKAHEDRFVGRRINKNSPILSLSENRRLLRILSRLIEIE